MIEPEMYDIVNDEDVVIGTATKQELHTQGLLHRGVNVLFYTPRKTVILQRRSPSKTTFPNKLDVTVGGHVDVGETYEVAALREIQEETGMVVEKEDLRLLAKIRQSNADPLTQTISNYFCSVFAFCFRGDISSLVIESGKAIEFVEKDAEELRRLTSENAGDYSFGLYQKQFMPIWDELAKL